MTDSELRALIRTSPAQGHRALYDTYFHYVYAIIFRLLRGMGSREDVEDCVVETFTDVLSHIDTIAEGSLKAYIGTAARNKALSLYAALNRQNQKTVPLDSIAEPSQTHVEEDYENKALRQVLLQKIGSLGEPDATILIQKYYYGRKMAEIAKMTGLTVSAAQMRCGRALKRLRSMLQDWR